MLLAFFSLKADDLQLFAHDTGASEDGLPVGAAYQFGNVALGDASNVTFRLKNTSSTKVYLVRAVYSSNQSFSVDGSILDLCLASNSFEDLNVSFAPEAANAVSAPLQIASKAYSSTSGCPSTPPSDFDVATVTTLSGSGIPGVLKVTGSLNGTSSELSSGDTIQFGQVPVGSTQRVQLTLTNLSGTSIDVATPSIVSSVFSQTPFAIAGVENVPASLAAGATTSFTVTFAPTVQALVTAKLAIGTHAYSLTGTGVAGLGLQSLLVSYTLPIGVHYNITPATPVDLGSALTGTSKTFIFTISNPVTNFDSETISHISISGSGFSLSSLPVLPVSLKPGDTTQFSVNYAPIEAGSQTAAVAIDSLVYTLKATATSPSLNPSFQFDPAMPASQQQARLSIRVPSAVKSAAQGTLTVSFASAVDGISDDPAILFLSTSSRSTTATFAAGADTATFDDGQSSVTFQTGTTAGTLKFTLSFASGETYSQSIDISPSPVQIVSATGTKKSPSLVLNLTAFDNTYSAGKVVFNFYDSRGTSLMPRGMHLDESADFHQYFFVNNKVGGAFILQARFPVTGDITAITAADVTIQNKNGDSKTTHINF